jgi:hypothetical protein
MHTANSPRYNCIRPYIYSQAETMQFFTHNIANMHTVCVYTRFQYETIYAQILYRNKLLTRKTPLYTFNRIFIHNLRQTYS